MNITWLQHGDDDTAHAFANTLLEAGFAKIESRGLCVQHPIAELRPKLDSSKYCPQCVRAVGVAGLP